MYSFEPTEEQQMIASTARDFAESEIRPHAHDADEKAKLPDGFLEKAWELGLAVGAVPEAYGGTGMQRSAVTGALFAEELAFGDPAFAMAMLAPALYAYPIVDYGTDEQKKQYLAKVTGAKFPKVTAAVVEPSMDFDPCDLATRAQKKGTGFVLSGTKCLVPGGSAADDFLIFASEGKPGLDQMQAFFVSRGTKGLTIGEREKNMGFCALDTVELALDGVEVPANARLGGDKGCNFERIMSFSRVALGALAVGTARASYEHSVNYAKERTAFGEPIASRQAIAFMLAEMALEIDAARLLVWEAAWRLDKGEVATKESYLAKRYTDQVALKVTDNGVQVMGGHGYIRENPVERWLRQGRGFSLFEGMAIV